MLFINEFFSSSSAHLSVQLCLIATFRYFAHEHEHKPQFNLYTPKIKVNKYKLLNGFTSLIMKWGIFKRSFLCKYVFLYFVLPTIATCSCCFSHK